MDEGKGGKYLVLPGRAPGWLRRAGNALVEQIKVYPLMLKARW